jgi:hypothetical protein
MLRNGKSQFIDTLMPIFDYIPWEHLESTQATSRLYCSHLYPRHMPKTFMEKRSKIVLVYRNPKDVAVSLFNVSKKVTTKFNTGEMGFSEYLRHYNSGNGK